MMFFLLVLLGVYLIFLLLVWIGWSKSDHNDPQQFVPKTSFSINIAVRNEVENIKSLLENLVLLNYPTELFEIVLIDDQSEDHTMDLAKEYLSKFHINYQVLYLVNADGKKNALKMGIETSNYDWIVTTDGDCVVNRDWLKCIDQKIQSTQPKMVVGPVCLSNSDQLFGQMQQMEFSSLIASAAAGLYFNRPNMCNGANLAFEKSIFFEVGGYSSHQNIASGDDEFLMHEVWQAYPQSVVFNKTISSVVYTQPSNSWKSFSNQRKRWASKWENYKLLDIKVLAFFVFIIQAGFVSGFIYSIANDTMLLFSILYSIKVIFDAFFFYNLMKWFGQPFHFFSFLILEVFYPFYVVIFAIIGRKKTYTWKHRIQ